MTLHIAVTGKDFGVLLSDSQGSTTNSEKHGWQKQIAVNGFLLGVAGHGGILNATLAHMRSLPPTADPFKAVEEFIETHVRPGVLGTVEFIAVGGTPVQPRIFRPGVFTQWSPPTGSVASIGSGAEFVFRALSRDSALQLHNSYDGVLDAFLWCVEYAASADESLTVDDRHLVSFLFHGRPYQMGHSEVVPSLGPQKLLTAWPRISGQYAKLVAMARTILAECGVARSSLAAVRQGTWSTTDTARLDSSAQSVKTQRGALTKELIATLTEYDQLLGRPPL